MGEKDNTPGGTGASSVQNLVEKWHSDYTMSMVSDDNSITPFECGSSTEDIIIDDITESEPMSAILNYCKRNFLGPYNFILGIVGLRLSDSSNSIKILGHIQTCIFLLILLLGYVIQYLFRFRRDKGYGHFDAIPNFTQIFHESGFFIYIIPSILHLFGFLTAVYVFKIRDNEQLQCLTERVFILTDYPKRLLIKLWSYIFYGILWLIFSTVSVSFLSTEETELMKIDWIVGLKPDDAQRLLKILLIITTFCHDLIQMIVIASYCVQCSLLRHYLESLKEKLLQRTIEPLNWMRELCEFQKFIHHLNRNLSLAVCYFTTLDIVYALSGTFILVKNYNTELSTSIIILTIGNIFSWIVLCLIPFFQASLLNETCRNVKTSGHQIRVRPFVHHNTLISDLDSIILYASSLSISAKIYRISIRGSYLCFLVVCIVIAILTVGMCLNV